MAPLPEDSVGRIQTICKEEKLVGSERYALLSSWYEKFLKGPSTAGIPKIPEANEKAESLIWLPAKAIELFEEWFGAGMSPTLSEWRKGTVVFVHENGNEEVETVPTYSCVEIRTDENAKTPLGTLENISATEEIPLLVRKALDAVPELVKVDEEDVRLWIRKSGEAEFRLCSSDEAKEGSSDKEEDLPEEFEEPSDTPSSRCIPTLRTVLGPSPAPQTIYILLELRSPDGKFPRRKVLTASTITPKHDKPQTQFFDKTRPTSVSFSRAVGPQVGQLCDAQRTADNRWLEGRIIQVQGNDMVVHYLSFPCKADETFHVDSARIQPPHSKVPDWRQQLKVGEEIDVHYSSIAPRRGGRLYQTWREKSGTTAWVAGTVRKIERNIPEPRVMVGVKFSRFSTESTVWVPIHSEKIAKRYTHSTPPKADTYGPQSSQGAPPMAGIVGLRNLGNTCYMNSMLQCLAHCEPLREHFLSGRYHSELNRRNPLGMGGQLAEAFADVMANMWSGNFQVVAPSKFKQVLGQMNHQFQGFQQHDSQELLTLLADGLHEDLNRIEKKPATEPIESNGRPDEVVAKESWETFKKRNDSKIVDEMYGLLKSHLECPVCKKEAVKFDAYSNVSVPVPSLEKVKVKVVFINSKREAIRCVASVPKRAPGRAIAEWIAERFRLPDVDDLVVADVFFNKTSVFFHRALVQGSEQEVGIGSAEPFEKANVKDARETGLVVVWQLHSLDELVKAPRANPTLMAQFDANWSVWTKEVKEVSVSNSDISKTKELIDRFFSPALCGPYPFAQRRLTQQLATLKNQEFAQMVARETIKRIETDATYSCFVIDADLAKLGQESEPTSVGSTTTSVTASSSSFPGGNANGDTASVASDAQSSTSGTAATKKVNSPFRVFTRLLSSSSSSAQAPNHSKENHSSPSSVASPAIPVRTASPALPALSGLDSNNSNRAALVVRIPVEIRHIKPKPGNKPNPGRQRCPMVLSIASDRTCDDLRRTIDEYIKHQCLSGFEDKSKKGDAEPSLSAAAGAAQLELNQGPQGMENGNTTNRNGVSSFASSSSKKPASSVPFNSSSTLSLSATPDSRHYYVLEIDQFDHTPLPAGPVPLVEALYLKATKVNGVVIYVKWNEGPAAEHAFLGNVKEQDESNPDKDSDAELGLGRIGLDASCVEKEDTGDKVLTLQQCLDVFRKREQLGEDDPWFCDRCKAHRCAFKTMDLWNTPKILVIHLKRFLYERVGGVLGERVQREKINDLVKFPMENFDIGPMLAAKKDGLSTVYDLFAVSNHMGGLGGGHYTAFVKADDRSWWLMNDGVCTKVDKANEESEVVSSNAYVLFYRRRD